MAMDVIDHTIHGAEMQYVECVLDPNEAMTGEAGSLFFMDAGIQMDTVLGSGSGNSGLLGKLMSAGKRLVTGESLFTTVYENKSGQRQTVAFAAPYPGKIMPINLSKTGGTFICQRDSFLCAARGVGISIAFQRKLKAGFFGGEGFIMQKLDGDGMAFIHAGGTVLERTLSPGEVIRVDTGCVVGYEPSVDFDVQFVGGIKTALFGGEGLFFATLRGPGKIYLQSLPFARLASRVFAAMPGGSQTDQHGMFNSILGGNND